MTSPSSADYRLALKLYIGLIGLVIVAFAFI